MCAWTYVLVYGTDRKIYLHMYAHSLCTNTCGVSQMHALYHKHSVHRVCRCAGVHACCRRKRCCIEYTLHAQGCAHNIQDMITSSIGVLQSSIDSFESSGGLLDAQLSNLPGIGHLRPFHRHVIDWVTLIAQPSL
jgi:hypothetical protein